MQDGIENNVSEDRAVQATDHGGLIMGSEKPVDYKIYNTIKDWKLEYWHRSRSVNSPTIASCAT